MFWSQNIIITRFLFGYIILLKCKINEQNCKKKTFINNDFILNLSFMSFTMLQYFSQFKGSKA